VSKRQTRKVAKENEKKARKLQKRANKVIGRKQHKGRGSKVFGLALIGTAVGIGAAYASKRRKTAQWDEYEPATPIGSAQVVGADDAAFEPTDPTTTSTTPNGTVTDSTPRTPR
jgi:hypothetical protein